MKKTRVRNRAVEKGIRAAQTDRVNFNNQNNC